MLSRIVYIFIGAASVLPSTFFCCRNMCLFVTFRTSFGIAGPNIILLYSGMDSKSIRYTFSQPRASVPPMEHQARYTNTPEEPRKRNDLATRTYRPMLRYFNYLLPEVKHPNWDVSYWKIRWACSRSSGPRVSFLVRRNWCLYNKRGCPGSSTGARTLGSHCVMDGVK